MLTVTGRFILDPKTNPPRLRTIEHLAGKGAVVGLGDGIRLLLRDHATVLEALLDLRVEIDEGYTGLGSVRDGCAVICVSNTCLDWAAKQHRPRIVAKVVGVTADEPRYILLTQPKLLGSSRAHRETPANRREAGLMPFVLIGPGDVECARCAGNRGAVEHLS